MRCNSLLLALLFALLFNVECVAQREYQPHFSIGGKAGVTMSKVAFTPGVEQSMVQGLTMGFAARYVEEKYFGLIAELVLEQRGWKEKFDETDFVYSRKITYIDLPLLTHVYFGSGRFKGFLNLGPVVGYMLGESTSANFDYEHPYFVQGLPVENRHTNQMVMPIKNKFDYGITVGLGIEWILKRKHSLQLEGRYYYGLGNVFSATKKDEFSASRGNSILLTVGYMFSLK